MKFAIVTSQITYVPRNSIEFYERIFEKEASSIATLIVVRNVSPALLVKIISLYVMGCPRIAGALLRNLVGLRRKKLQKLCRAYNIPFITVRSVDDGKIIDWIKTHQVDVLINFRARCIFKKKLLEAPRLGCVNIHHGILPDYRGLFCDLYALSEDRPAGFSIHKMEQEVDAGRIYVTQTVSRAGEKDYAAYLSRLADEEAASLIEFIRRVNSHEALPSGVPNAGSHVVVTTTPRWAHIKQMQAGGMLL